MLFPQSENTGNKQILEQPTNTSGGAVSLVTRPTGLPWRPIPEIRELDVDSGVEVNATFIAEYLQRFSPRKHSESDLLRGMPE